MKALDFVECTNCATECQIIECAVTNGWDPQAPATVVNKCRIDAQWGNVLNLC